MSIATGCHFPISVDLAWHPSRLTKEGGCIDLFVSTMHLKGPLVLFVSML